jgi:hygromycin-B 7''-O-kinase
LATPPELPVDPCVADFDTLQEDPARWIGVLAALGERYSSAPAVPAGEGTVLVALLGRELVLKLYPPFLRDHFEFERAMLCHLQGRLSLPTPRLVDSAEHAGWPYLVMTQLPGTPLESTSTAAPALAHIRSATSSRRTTCAATRATTSPSPCCCMTSWRLS